MATKPRSPWLREPGENPSPDPASTYLNHLGPGSRRAIRQSLEAIAAAVVRPDHTQPIHCELFRFEQLTEPDIDALRIALTGQYAPATVNKTLSALRGVLRASRDLGLMNERDFQSAVRVANVPAIWQPPEVSILSRADVRGLFMSCAARDSLAGLRDAALLTIFLATGLRRTEAIALNLADLDAAHGVIEIRSPEPHKCRTVYLTVSARRHIDDWLAAANLKDASTPLLLAVNKSDRVQHRRLTDQAIYSMIHRIGADAGVNGISTRTLRLTYIVSLIETGLAAEEVQALAGHASWLTTQEYARLAATLHTKHIMLPPLLINLTKTLRAMRAASALAASQPSQQPSHPVNQQHSHQPNIRGEKGVHAQ